VLTKRVGEFAAKRKMSVGYHAHTQATPPFGMRRSHNRNTTASTWTWHYTAAQRSPIPFLQQKHGRIVSMHMKDRKYEKNGG